MASRSWLRWAALAVALAALLGVWFFPTDEKRVREVAEALVAAANRGPADLAAALDEHAASGVRLSVAELSEPLEGKEAIVAGVAQAQQLAQKLHFRIESVDVTVEGRRARLTADFLTLLGPEVPELRRPRRGVALFEKRGERFRLVSADIGAERLDQPEARP